MWKLTSERYKCQSVRYRWTLLLFNWSLGWLFSTTHFYLIWGKFPEDNSLFAGILTSPCSSILSLLSLIDSVFSEVFLDIITSILFFGFWPLLFSYWSLMIYIIYKFIKTGKWLILLTLFIITLLSCCQCHYEISDHYEANNFL